MLFTQLTPEEEGIRDLVIQNVYPKETFSVPAIHAQLVLKKQYPRIPGAQVNQYDAARADLTQRGVYSNITNWFTEHGFANHNGKTIPFTELVLTEKGEILWAYNDFYKYSRSTIPLTENEIIQKIPSIIEAIEPYGEFILVCPAPKLGSITMGTTGSKEIPKEVRRSMIELDKQIIRQYEANKRQEDVLNYLVNRGFAINRHDIKDGRGTHRQLTDKGRELKECGSIEAYKAKITAVREADEAERKWREETSRRQHQLAIEQAELSKQQAILNKNQLFVNICIAVATFVAALYSSFQILDFYEHHYVAWREAAYFASGLVLAFLLLLVGWLLKRIFRKISKRPSE